MTNNLELSNNEVVVYKNYLDTVLSNVQGQILFIETDFIEFNLRRDKQSEKEVPIVRVVKTTEQILHNKGLLDIYYNADNVLKDYLNK